MGLDVARDEEALTVVVGYLRAKHLPIAKDNPTVANLYLDEVGLLEHPELLADLEGAYYAHQKEKQEKEAAEKEAQAAANQLTQLTKKRNAQKQGRR